MMLPAVVVMAVTVVAVSFQPLKVALGNSLKRICDKIACFVTVVLRCKNIIFSSFFPMSIECQYTQKCSEFIQKKLAKCLNWHSNRVFLSVPEKFANSF